MDWTRKVNPVSPNIVWDSSSAAPFGLATNWNVNIRSGDSSNPAMILVKDQLVLVSHNSGKPSYDSPISFGPNYAFQISAINQQMHYLSTNNGVGTNYQLTPFSLTNWPTIH